MPPSLQPEPQFELVPAPSATPQRIETQPPASPRLPAPEAIPAAPFDQREYLASAGLQMVETRPGSVPMREQEAETAKLGRARRPRSAAPVEEELVQIETRK